MSKFALIVDGEVAGIAIFPDFAEDGELHPKIQKNVAIFRSNPVIVEITDEDIDEGYIWDGTSFSAPVE